MALGYKIPAALKPSGHPTQKIENPGGVKAPTGRSVAGQMVKNRRGGAGQPNKRQQQRATGGRPNKAVPKPYSALDSPYANQGQFETAVKRTAKAGYEPELNDFNREEQGQKNLSTSREGSNVDIYNKATQSAQESLGTAKSAMADIASRQNAATAQGQATLNAALSNTGVAGLAGVTDPNADAYKAQAQQGTQLASTSLGAEQSALTNELTKDTGVPLAGLRDARHEENERLSGELGKIGEKRTTTMRNIPNLLAAARKQLSEQEVNRAGTKLQNQLAGKKLGSEEAQSKRTNATNRAQIAAGLTQSREANAQKAAEYAASTGLEGKKLSIELAKFEKEERDAKGAKAKEAAKLAGERFSNGVSAMSGYLKKDPKTEYDEATLTPQDREAIAKGAVPVALQGKTPYRKNAQQLYNELTQQQNLTAPEAFRLMKSSGNGYIEKFANEHEKLYNAAIKRNKYVKTVTTPAGGKQEQRQGTPPNLPKKR